MTALSIILIILDYLSLTFTVLDISSIKFDVSSNPNMLSTIGIHVRPSFEAESLTACAVPGYSSKFAIF